jgi:prolyl-tRNA editing enzyme YbaK/EbsC (Cys-tRNA(Pro) deacylase)
MADNDDLLHPAVAQSLAAYRLSHEVLACPPDLADTAEFSAHYGFSLDEAANAILVASRKVDPPVHALCVVLGSSRLDVNHAVRDLLGVRRVSFADAETTVAVTGMMIGGVTPPGVEKVPVYIDAAVMLQPRVVVGGGNRTSKLLLAPGELLKLPGVTVVEGLALAREEADPR